MRKLFIGVVAVFTVCGFAANAAARTFEITQENRAGGVLQSVEVAVSAGETESWLVRASGPADAGDAVKSWAALDPIRLPAEATTLTVAVPEGWGDTALTMRLFLTDKLTAGDYDYAVEYVESTGAQYINTQFIPDKNTHLELTFSHQDTSHDQPAYGVRHNGAFNFAVWFNRENDATLGKRYVVAPMLGGKYENKLDDMLRNCPLPLGTIVTFSHGLDVGFVVTPKGGEPFVCYGPDSFTTTDTKLTHPLPLMALDTDGAIDSRKFYGRFYGGQIYDGATLARDYQPCVKNGVVGVWDFAEGGGFTPSATTTALVAGPEDTLAQLERVIVQQSATYAVPRSSVKDIALTRSGASDVAVSALLVDVGGAATADLCISYGTSPDALSTTVTLAEGATVGEVASGTLTGLVPNTIYYAQAFARANGAGQALSAAFRFLTPAAGVSGRSFKIASVNRNAQDTVVSLDLVFSVVSADDSVTNGVFLATGLRDAGAVAADWDQTDFVAYVPPAQNEMTIPAPEGWGSSVFAMRPFFGNVILPYDTALDYIETAGAAYFDTEVTCSSTVNAELDVQMTGSSDANSSPIFGARPDGSSTKRLAFWIRRNSNYDVAYNYGSYDSSYLGKSSAANRCRIRNDGGAFFVDDVLVGSSTVVDFSVSLSLYMFRLHINGGVDTRTVSGKLWGLKIWEGGDLVRDYQPCVKDGVVGVWDYVNGTFTKSLTATAFTAGPGCLPIPRPQDEIAYGYSDESVKLGAKPIVALSSVTANADASATVAWDLVSCGSGSAADIYAVWGGAADSLSNTNLLASAQGLGEGTADLACFLPGRTYYVQLLAQVEGEWSDPSAILSVELPKLAEPDTSGLLGPKTTVVSGGGSVHTLAFEPKVTGAFTVYRACGSVMGGDGTNGWERVENLGEIDVTGDTFSVPAPTGWGTTLRFARYYIVGDMKDVTSFTPVEYLSSVNQNNSNPMWIDTGVPLAYGETLRVKWAQASLENLSEEDKGWGASSSSYAISSGGRRKNGKICAHYHGNHRYFQPEFPVSDLDTETVWEDVATITNQTWVDLIGSNGATYASEKANTPNGANWKSGNNLFLFKCSYPDYPFPGKKRIYGATLRNDLAGEAVFKLVPGVKDGEPGFFDFVSGEFLTNAGAGTFEVGGASAETFATYSTTAVAEDATLPSVGTFAVDDVSEGDAVTVSGRIGSAGGDTATVQVEISRTGDFTDAVAWPAATGVAESGEWSVRIHADDTQAAGYIVPGVETFVRVRVVATSGKSDVSDPQTFTTLRESALGTVTSSAQGRNLTVTAQIASLGANTTYVWVSWTQGGNSGATEKKPYPQGSAKDSAAFTFAVPDWTTASCTVHCSNDCATAAWDMPVAKNVTASDNATYTWKNEVTNGNWNDAANWTPSNVDCLGWPQTMTSIATFDGATARVVLTSNVSIGRMKLLGVFDVTFAGGKQLNPNVIDVPGKRGWRFQVVDGTKVVMQGTDFGDYTGTENCLISVRGQDSLFNPHRIGLSGVSNRIEAVDGGYIWNYGSHLAVGGEALVLDVNSGKLGGMTFNPGDLSGYTTIPPKVMLRGESAQIRYYAGIGSFHNGGMVAVDWEYEIPATGYVETPVYNSAASNLVFPREDTVQTANSGWQRFSVPKSSPFFTKGKGTVDHFLFFWEKGIRTNRVELVKLPHHGTWFYTYGTNRANPLAAPAKEGDLPTGIWARLTGATGMALILK